MIFSFSVFFAAVVIAIILLCIYKYPIRWKVSLGMLETPSRESVYSVSAVVVVSAVILAVPVASLTRLTWRIYS